MTTLVIKSRKLGKALTFTGNGKYIWVDTNGQHGIAGKQICYGGCFMGNTVMASEDKFEKACRRWYSQYVKLPSWHHA